jgi:hypothetical protein
MAVGEALGRYWSHIAVTVTITGQAVATGRHGPEPAAAVYAALVAGGIWAWHGRVAQYSSVSGGQMVQALTWDIHVDRPTEPSDDDWYRQVASRMRQTGEHVRRSAARLGLERITLATSSTPARYSEASSTRQGSSGHVWLGMRWFHEAHTHHLPAVLEHELAHLRRRDSTKRLIAESSCLMATALAAGLLPLSTFALLAMGACLFLALALYRWWVELACDMHAVRACGRQAVTDMWRAELNLDRSRPRASKAWATLGALRTHPPLRLRIIWAERVPLPKSPVTGRHPLHAPATGNGVPRARP